MQSVILVAQGITPDNSPSALGLADHELACMQLTSADDYNHDPLIIFTLVAAATLH